MKWTNARLYLLVALCTLGPVALRVLFWSTAQANPLDAKEVASGRELFTREFKQNDPLCAEGDGLGPVFNASSCVACHNQGGIGGGGDLSHNVTAFVNRTTAGNLPERLRQGVIHASATRKEFQETLASVSPGLPPISQPKFRLANKPQDLGCGVPFITPKSMVVVDANDAIVPVPAEIQFSQRNTPALFGASLIDSIPERVLYAQERTQKLKWGMAPASDETVPVGRVARLADGRLGRFGWQGQSASLVDFVQAACANELGLSNPGQKQPAPLGAPRYPETGYDLSTEQCLQITAFISSLRKPREIAPDSSVRRAHETGRQDFMNVGCASCHSPSLGEVDGIYSDLLLHRMGRELEGGGSYGGDPTPIPQDSPGDTPLADEWRTPPLWGVADSAPYMHDGRAPTLLDAIQAHGGQASGTVQRFNRLSSGRQQQMIAFLKTLRAP